MISKEKEIKKGGEGAGRKGRETEKEKREGKAKERMHGEDPVPGYMQKF